MPTSQLNPHDRYTHSLMSYPKVIEEFFRTHLPHNIKKSLDFKSIKLYKESYIDDKLKLKIADLIYEAKLNGRPGFFYLLFEHASTPDELLPFRMLKYMLAIMDDYTETTKNKDLPFVYPIILYTGRAPYKHSMDLFDLFPENVRDLVRETMFAPYQLIDLTQIADEHLEENLHYGTMARTLKHIRDPCINSFVSGIINELKQLERLGEVSYILTTITYLSGVGATSNMDEFKKSILKLESINEEKVMTFIDHLKQDFFNKAKEQVREQARLEGHEDVAKLLIAEGMNYKKVAALTDLPEERVLELFEVSAS